VNVLDNDKYVLIFEAKLSGVRQIEKNIHVQADDRTLVIKATRPDPEATEQDFQGYTVVDDHGKERIVVGPPIQSFERSFALPSKVDARKAVAFFGGDSVLVVRIPKTGLPANIEVSTETASERRRRALIAAGMRVPISDEARTPIAIDFLTADSASIPAPAIEAYRGRMLEDGKSFVQNGVRYFPLSSAAPVVQAPPSTILHWIKKETNFAGRPLDSYYFAPANRYFLSEESIERAANRFIDWRSQEPAGPVTIGHTRDKSGYVRLQEAAQTLGVDHHTMWRWAAKGTAPTDKPLDVIKDPATDQFYIREAEVSKLKKLVPRSGLRAGRRKPPTPRPS
jgi:HSP20 family molecular chaperone IbpA